MQMTLDVGALDIQGELISEHYLENRLKNTKKFIELAQEAEKKFDEIKAIYEDVKSTVEYDDEEDIKQEFLEPVLSELGHNKSRRHREAPFLSHKGRKEVPDYVLFNDKEDKDEAKKNKENSDRYFDFVIGLVEAKKPSMSLDYGRKENPAVQTKTYLRLTETKWGILTNGEKWRLYCKESGYSSNVYLEFDLFDILEHDKKADFKHFYAFFSHDAFKRDGEKSFLDQVYEENVKFAREVEDDLEENVYEALAILAEGFLEFGKNDLDVDDLDDIHDSSLILLYRMLFLLYAESKGLIEFNYDRNSILKIREEIRDDLEKGEKYAPLHDDYWRRLRETFEIVNLGSKEVLGEEGVPPYNGGLFDSEKHSFLEENRIGNNYLMRAVDRLAARKENGEMEWVDYETLQIRHLGSIYEKLLEYKLDVAEDDLTVNKDGEYVEAGKDEDTVVKKGEIYLKTDKGERKATGSYYTPDYIVEYIVENTVGELIDEKVEEAREEGESEAKAILELNVLDPAMGSGHFLVGAVEYMAEELVKAVNRDIENGIWDEGEMDQDEAKREIVSHCIYGVDVNPLAVELAKLSLWLTTLSEGKPLNFLDHRLKCGNSLIGTEIDKLPYYPGQEKSGNLYTPYIELLTEQVSKLDEIEDESLEDVKKKEELFQKIMDSKAYKRVKTLADARTATHFGVEVGGSDPKQRYMDLVNEAYYGDKRQWKERSNKKWVKQGLNIAEKKNFFHWQLEYPEMFFDQGKFKDDPGFDAVIGNPPYVKRQNIDDKKIAEYYEKAFESTTYNWDLYLPFTEKGFKLINDEGEFGYILPSKFTSTETGKGLRKFIENNANIKKFVDFDTYQVFQDVTTYTCLLFLNKKSKDIEYLDINRSHPYSINEYRSNKTKLKESLSGVGWDLRPSIIGFENMDDKLKDKGEFFTGIETGSDKIFILEPEDDFYFDAKKYEGEIVHKVLKGGDVDPYYSESEKLVIVPYSEKGNLIEWDILSDKYTEISNYLKKYEEKLRSREDGKMDNKNWYGYVYPKNLNKFNQKRIIWPDIAIKPEFAIDEEYWHVRTVASFRPFDQQLNLHRLIPLLNSKVFLRYMIKNTNKVRGGYLRFRPQYIKEFPIKKSNEKLENLSKKLHEKQNMVRSLNLVFKDYLGTYSDGKSLDENYIPIKGVSDTILTDTQQDKEKLRIGRVDFELRGETLILKASARYKPENRKEYETDRWGYTETELIPAMKFTGFEKELALIREFTKLAVDEAGGFANFRESATKTLSILDRLEKLTLPKLSDVESGLEKYLEQKEKAERLEEEIKETDHTIDAIVFDLYDLTEEEIETVLDSLDTDEEEKVDILNIFEHLKE